jgi:hypothetical protein
LTVSTNTLTIAAPANSTATFNITSNISWTAVSSQSWLVLSSNNGTGNSTMAIAATENPTTVPRTATITVSGTGATTQTITVTQEGGTIGINNNAGKEFEIYPNPVNDFLYFKANHLLTNEVKVNIYSIDGRLLKYTGFMESIDMSSMKNGIYIIKITSNSATYQFKIVKE